MTNVKLGQIAERASQAGDAAFSARNRAKEFPASVSAAESKGYNEGKAAAYTQAHTMMQSELRRLMYLMQNGSLTVEDFGVEA